MIPGANLFQTPNTEYQNVEKTPTIKGATPVKSSKTCFNCGKRGHFFLQCPNRRQLSTPTQGTTAPPNRNGSSTPTQAQQNYARGRVNQVTMKEAQTTATMVHGTFLINYFPSYSLLAIFSFLLLRISGRDSFLRVVALSHSKTSNFTM
jgi:hypothetical protein